MSAQRILIITNGHLCRNPRPLKEALTLGRAGYGVTVLTVRNHAPSEAPDRELLLDAPFRREVIEMLPGCGASAFAVLRNRFLLWSARNAASRLGVSSIHALGPAGEMLRRARRHPADLIIAHNELAHWVGTQLLAEGRLVAADFEDWHSEDLLPEHRRGRPLTLLREVERVLLHRAAYVSTTSHALAAALHARHGGRLPEVIPNCFPLQPDPRSGPPGDPPAFFWFSQTLGPGRGVEEFVEAWTRTARSSRLVLLGEAYGGFDRDLLARVPPDRRSVVDFLPLVPPAGLSAVIARHDLGLALERRDIPSRNLTITNKLLQYLNAGLAVVASETAGHREVLAQGPDAGVLIDLGAPASVTFALDGLLADRDGLQRRQQAARRLAAEVYCWEREEPHLLALVAAACPRR